MIQARRSQSIATVSLLIALSALAGCKGGSGGGESAGAAASGPDASGNHAPTITGSGPTRIAPNAPYSFAPRASDPDGDQVSFQIQNKPTWATFNTVTGELSGTPTAAQAGVYAGVAITASDGKRSASLPAFSITVSETVSGGGSQAATLSWTAPTENTDGSVLTDLAGFVIMYGTTSTALDQTVRIDNPSVDTFVLQDLPAGTHYFSIKAYTANGAESELAPPVSKQIG